MRVHLLVSSGLIGLGRKISLPGIEVGQEQREEHQHETQSFSAGQSFDVPGRSGFTIVVEGGLCEYICSYLPA